MHSQQQQFPETQEAIERWRQGKINIFDEMARLESERNQARDTVHRLRLERKAQDQLIDKLIKDLNSA